MITVAIVAHNESLRLMSCLNSLANQSGIEEILIVDNASTDNTREVAERFAESHSHLKLRTIRLSRNNLGLARATAIASAKSELLAFLDADCIAGKNWLNELSCDWSESFAGLGGPIIFPSGHSKFTRARANLHNTWLGHLGSEQMDHSAKVIHTRGHLPTANVVYNREAVLRVGNFSADFERVCEDVDLSLRLQMAGYRLAWTPTAIVEHHQSEGWFDWAKRTFRYGKGQAQARSRRFWRWPNRLRWPVIFGPALILIFPLYLIVVIFEGFRKSNGVSDSIALSSLLVMTHLCYGTGLFVGLIFPMSIQPQSLKNEWPTTANI